MASLVALWRAGRPSLASAASAAAARRDEALARIEKLRAEAAAFNDYDGSMGGEGAAARPSKPAFNDYDGSIGGEGASARPSKPAFNDDDESMGSEGTSARSSKPAFNDDDESMGGEGTSARSKASKDETVSTGRREASATTVKASADAASPVSTAQLEEDVQTAVEEQAALHRAYLAWAEATEEPAWAEIKALCRTLRQHEAVMIYLVMLQKIEAHSAKLQRAAKLPPADVLEAFDQLLNLQTLVSGSPFANLQVAVDSRVQSARQQLQERLSTELLAASESIKWPAAKSTLDKSLFGPERLRPFREALTALLVFQNPYVEASSSLRHYLAHGPDVDHLAESDEPLPHLLAIQVLCKPLQRRFQYHFLSDRPTNQLDKPEWYFAHGLGLLRDHSLFLCNDVQPILNERALSVYSAKGEFARALVAIVGEKLKRDLAELKRPGRQALLIHTVHEALVFDRDLHDVHDLPRECHGVTHVVMEDADAREAWLEAHRTRALMQCSSIVDDEHAMDWHLEAVAADLVRTTVCAEHSVALLQAITAHYRHVAMTSVRAEFLEHVHMAVAFHLADALAAGLPTLDFRHRLGPNELLGTLRRMATAAHVARVLESWADDLTVFEGQYFLELWEHRAQHGYRDEPHVWSTSVSRLRTVVNMGHERVVEATVADIVDALGSYLRRQPWTLPEATGATEPGTLPEWTELLARLQHRLVVVDRELAADEAEAVAKEVAAELDAVLMARVVKPNRFRFVGGKRLDADLAQLFALFRRYSQRPANLFMGVKEAAIILRMPPDQLAALQQQLRSPDWPEGTAHEHVLEPLGVYQMTMADALAIANRRRDRDA